MILRSIEMESFGKFHNQTIEFRRGMNLVIGPNETGKSTIAEAVPAVLFGTDRLERYKPWGRNACSASLFSRVAEGRYRLNATWSLMKLSWSNVTIFTSLCHNSPVKPLCVGVAHPAVNTASC